METANQNLPLPDAGEEPKRKKWLSDPEHWKVAYEARLRNSNGNGRNSKLPNAFYGDLDPKYEVMREKPWHRAAIGMAQNGFNQTEIAIALGVSRLHVSSVLRQTWARQAMINDIQKNIRDELHDMIEKASKDAFVKLVDLSQRAKSETVQLSASAEILNRFLGKPTQPVLNQTGDLKNLSDEELARIATGGSSATAATPPSDTKQPS